MSFINRTIAAKRAYSDKGTGDNSGRHELCSLVNYEKRKVMMTIIVVRSLDGRLSAAEEISYLNCR